MKTLSEAQEYAIQRAAAKLNHGKSGIVWSDDINYRTVMSLERLGLMKVKRYSRYGLRLTPWDAYLTDTGKEYAREKGYLR